MIVKCPSVRGSCRYSWVIDGMPEHELVTKITDHLVEYHGYVYNAAERFAVEFVEEEVKLGASRMSRFYCSICKQGAEGTKQEFEEHLMAHNKEIKMETFTAHVVFADSPRKYEAKFARKYTFKCDIVVEIGDMVVVDCVNGYQVVKVVATSEGVHEQATAWVLSKVDMNGHAKRARIAELEKLIEKEVSKVSYLTQAEMLSGISLNFKPNEKLRKLMFELNELTGA